MTVSVIIPTLNEEASIGAALSRVRAESPLEILVADGGSTDRTVEIAAGLARVLRTERGRARQMNAAARIARGDVLWFLHADCLPAVGAMRAIVCALEDPGVDGGNLRIVYQGGDLTARVLSWINEYRCRFGVFYGDSGIFCRRAVFEELGCFPEWPILEDYALARELWRRGRVRFLREELLVSDRRWRRQGLLATLWSWFWVQGLYLAGVSPRRLAAMYRDVR